MVATSLPVKPKLADEHRVDENKDFEDKRANDRGCYKRGFCWPSFKLLILLILTALFSLIFSGNIMELIYVSENVDSEVRMTFEKPTNVTFPAITVCNNNPIQISKFCGKHPEHCSNSTDENGPAVTVKSSAYLTNWTSSDTIPLGQSWQDFAKTCLIVHSVDDKQIECKYVRNLYWSLAHQSCFTFLSGEDKLTGDYRKAALWMVLDFQPEENIGKQITTGGQLFVHDPDTRIPVGFPISSYTLRPGKMYRYRLQQTNYYRLSPPFKSGCKDYEDDSGVTSQEECYTSCLYQKFTSVCGCMPDIIPFFDVGHATNYCKADNASRNCVKGERRTVEETCNDACPVKCVEHTYDVKVDEFDIPEYNSDIRNARKNMANIWIKFDSNEQKTYNEIPTDTTADVFPALICLNGAAVIFLLLMVTETIIRMCRICKSGSSKNADN